MSGRSVSQEIEYRVERSFERANILEDALAATYGREVAGLILLIAEAMTGAGRWAAWISEGGMTAATGRSWPSKPYAFREAVNAVTAVLATRQPEGEVVAPKQSVLQAYGVGAKQTLGGFMAESLHRMLEGDLVPAPEFQEPIARIRRLLGKDSGQ